MINSFIKNNPTSRSIQELEVNGRVTDSLNEIVEILNKYFCEVGSNIIKDIEMEKSNLNFTANFNEVQSNETLVLEPTNEQEISDIISNLKPNAAPGHDGVSARDILHNKSIIVPVVVDLVNQALISGEFPRELKIAKVCPIFKTGSKTQISNYRPISLISIFSKIIENVMKARMLCFVDEHIGTDKFQYGFLKNSSTLSATVDLMDYLSTNLDSRKIVIAVFVDLRKAFDVVSHAILLEKLELMGFRGGILNLIKSYLYNRQQYVCVDDFKSTIAINNCGVPQGSVLGPFLYSLFVVSLRISQLKAKYFTFADDTVLMYCGDHEELLTVIVNDDLHKYYNWLLNQNLKINLDKTKYIIFKQKNKKVNEIEIKINNVTLEKVSSIKYLGLYLDEDLNWSIHIEHINNKIIPLIGALFRCRQFLTKNAKYKIYNAYILSILRYLIPVWGTCGITNFNKVQVLQNRALKTLFQLNYRMHTDEVYQLLNLLPVSYILKIEQSKLIYKVIHNIQKSNILITHINQVHSHDTRNNTNIYLSLARTNIALHNPYSEASTAFNALPTDISSETSLGRFANKLKVHFFEQM